MSPDDHRRGPGRNLTVSVCLPALDEERTTGAICQAIQAELMPGLVDELLVIDSGSCDATMAVARAAGAQVHHVGDISPRVARGGKGEALWKSLAIARGDIVVWMDSDIRNFDPRFVSHLVEPLLASPDLVMTKAYYRRPLVLGDGTYAEDGGGRVTELALRPLLNLLTPELSDIIQPLSGEYAMRTDVARDLPFLSGYGVDVGLLVDVITRHGWDALRQVDLGTRVHENRTLRALGQTSFEVLGAFIARVADRGSITLHRPLGTVLRQFDSNHGSLVTRFGMQELPSWRSLENEMSAVRMQLDDDESLAERVSHQ